MLKSIINVQGVRLILTSVMKELTLLPDVEITLEQLTLLGKIITIPLTYELVSDSTFFTRVLFSYYYLVDIKSLLL